jgi:hypothetical protein
MEVSVELILIVLLIAVCFVQQIQLSKLKRYVLPNLRLVIKDRGAFGWYREETGDFYICQSAIDFIWERLSLRVEDIVARETSIKRFAMKSFFSVGFEEESHRVVDVVESMLEELDLIVSKTTPVESKTNIEKKMVIQVKKPSKVKK